jgi:hypothetical protein
MLIRCPKCGLVYSYVRNICHLCKNHSIFFGALLNGDRREYQWNCEKNSIPSELKNCQKSKNNSKKEEKEIIITHEIEHKWNCICLSD